MIYKSDFLISCYIASIFVIIYENTVWFIGGKTANHKPRKIFFKEILPEFFSAKGQISYCPLLCSDGIFP